MQDLKAWKFMEDEDGLHRAPREIIMMMVQEHCPHRSTTTEGTNQYKWKKKCKVCNKVLMDEAKPRVAKAKTTSSSSRPPSETTENAEISPSELEQFQQFMRWQRSQASYSGK